jgi:thymidylate synthase
MNMNKADKQYKELLNKILTEGVLEQNRTGVAAKRIAGFMFEHDMSEGFPLLTLRKLPFKSTKVELEFFIKGLRNKKWLQERGCKYWDQWCCPQKVPYGNDKETKAKMAAEDDLGLIYGTQWRDFRDPESPEGSGVDQLKNIVNTLKRNPSDRRMLCSAWNPLVLEANLAALPSCHDGFRVSVIDGYLNLAWTQRSVDTYLGFPANFSSYGLLLHLLAKESGFKEGKLVGFLWDVHLYENQIEQSKELLTRGSYDLPQIVTKEFSSIFDWEHSDTELINYQSFAPLSASVSV